jgi:multidrug transporter EmrE-like cation transporter
MTKAQAALCVALTIGLTVYGQLVVKWQVLEAGEFPAAMSDRFEFLLRLVTNPWVISVFIAAALAAVSWMAAMTRLELSAAYPFVAITFALVLILSGVFFDEAVTPAKTAGVGLIILGLVVGTR